MDDQDKTREHSASDSGVTDRRNPGLETSTTKPSQGEAACAKEISDKSVERWWHFDQALLDAIPIPIFCKDTQGTYTGCNKAFEEFLNIPREHLMGKSVYDVAPKELADGYRAKDLDLLAHPGTQVYETKVRDLRFVTHDVIFHKATYLNAEGEIVGLIGAVLDITERRRAEERLHKDLKLRGLLLELYEKAPRLTDKELYDYFLEQAVDLSDSTVGFLHAISDDQKNVVLTTWNSEALENCKASYETHYPVAQAGNWVDSLRLKRPVVYNDFPRSPNQKGLPAGHAPVHRFVSIPVMEGDKVRIIFGIGNKIEEYVEDDVVEVQLVANELYRIIKQRRVEEALRESEAKHRALIETTDTGYVIVDLSGRVLDANAEYVRMSGHEELSEIVGRSVVEWTAPDDREVNARAVEQCVQEGAVRNLELHYVGASGEIVPIEINATMVASKCGPHILTLARDITERKRVEAEREKLIAQLQNALTEVKKLSGLLPICASCKKIRNDKGYWEQIEIYIHDRSEADFTHGICPECAKKLYSKS
jgi:PAS domain S-box-containing protein